jgi:hypothetical protein
MSKLSGYGLGFYWYVKKIKELIFLMTEKFEHTNPHGK